jgi:hypothetical protein
MSRLAALGAAALTALAALAPRPAGAGGTPAAPEPPPPAREPPRGAQRVVLACRFGPWSTSGACTLRDATGVLLDEGAAEDDGSFAGCEGAVVRRFEGARGTLRLRLAGFMRIGAFPPVVGRWEVVDGTGTWAALRGGGTYTSAVSGEPRSTIWDRQHLVGFVNGR